VDVVPDGHFSSLIEAWGTENNNRNLFAQSSTLTDSPSRRDDASWIQSEADENQVRAYHAGLQNRFILISGCIYLVAFGREQSPYPVARLLHVLNYKDDKTALLIGCHDLLYCPPSLLLFLPETYLAVCALSHRASILI